MVFSRLKRFSNLRRTQIDFSAYVPVTFFPRLVSRGLRFSTSPPPSQPCARYRILGHGFKKRFPRGRQTDQPQRINHRIYKKKNG